MKGIFLYILTVSLLPFLSANAWTITSAGASLFRSNHVGGGCHLTSSRSHLRSMKKKVPADIPIESSKANQEQKLSQVCSPPHKPNASMTLESSATRRQFTGFASSAVLLPSISSPSWAENNSEPFEIPKECLNGALVAGKFDP